MYLIGLKVCKGWLGRELKYKYPYPPPPLSLLNRPIPVKESEVYIWFNPI